MKMMSQSRPMFGDELAKHLSPDPTSGGEILQGIFGGGTSPENGELDDDESDNDDDEDEEANDDDSVDDDTGEDEDDASDDGDVDGSQEIDFEFDDPAIQNILAKSNGDPKKLAKSYRELERYLGQQGQQVGQLAQQNAMLQQLTAQLLAQSAAVPNGQQQIGGQPQQAQPEINPDEFLAKLTEKGPAAVQEIVAGEIAKVTAAQQAQQAQVQQLQMAAALQQQAQAQQEAMAFQAHVASNDQELEVIMANDPDFHRVGPIMHQMLNLPQYQQATMIPGGIKMLYQAAKGFAAQQGNRTKPNKAGVRAQGSGGGRYVESDSASRPEKQVYKRIFG